MNLVISNQPTNTTGVTLSNPTGAIGTYALAYTVSDNPTDGSWKYDGVTYNGTILTVGATGDYATLFEAYDAVEFNPAITTALLLVDSTATAGIHNSLIDGRIEGYLGISGVPKTLFVRGTGALPTDTIIAHEKYGFYHYHLDCDVYLENITFTQQLYRMCIPFIPESDNVNFFVNKCILSTYNGGYSYGSVDFLNSKEGIQAEFSYVSVWGWTEPGRAQFSLCDLSSITCEKTFFEATPAGYGCVGTLAGDYVDTPTTGYGSAYGSLLITDWVPFNERVLSWGGGELVEIPTDGSYTLSDGTNTITATVDYSELPETDESDTITVTCFDRYWIGNTGLWNDTDHWAYESGGTSGAPVPTADDDVFIDANSFTEAGHYIKIVGR